MLSVHAVRGVYMSEEGGGGGKLEKSLLKRSVAFVS